MAASDVSLNKMTTSSSTWIQVEVDGSNQMANSEETEQLLTNDHFETSTTDDSTDGRLASDNGESEEGNEESEGQDVQQARVAASGSVGCILGCLIAGPVGAALAGLGTAYAASSDNEGATRDIARAMGDVALTARDKAMEVDRKHHIVEKTKQAASTAWERAKELNHNHQIYETTKNYAISTSQTAIEFAKRHELVERSIQGIGQGMEYVGGLMVTKSRNSIDNTSYQVVNPSQATNNFDATSTISNAEICGNTGKDM